MKRQKSANRLILRTVSAAVMATFAGSSAAIEFKTENGWEGTLNTTLSASSSWRVEDRDKALIANDTAVEIGLLPIGTTQAQGVAAGYVGGSDTANANFKKGDRYSTLLKFISELSMHKGDAGGLLRVKGWYDEALKNNNPRYGNQPNGYRSDVPLSDDTFPNLNRFDGTALLDAYVYNTFDVAGKPLQIRLGKQANNWGEGLFILGANQISPIDITALNKAGTQIKEALMPVWSITGNLGLDNGVSLEGFYQFKWEPYNLENCGTYFGGDGGTGSPGKCDMAKPVGLTARDAAAINTYIPFVNHPKPKDSGQWGLAMRFPVSSIDTEFGLYAMNVHARTPSLSGEVGGDLRAALLPFLNSLDPRINSKLAVAQAGIPLTAWRGSVQNLLAPGLAHAAVISGFAAQVPGWATLPKAVQDGILAQNAQLINAQVAAVLPQLKQGLALYTAGLKETTAWYEYPEDVRTYALSASTTLAGWSIGSEISYSPNTPVQMSAADFLYAILLGDGPLGSTWQVGGNPAGNPAAAGITAQGVLMPALSNLAPIPGYKEGFRRTTKKQFQINGLNTLPAMWGASGGLFIAEAGFQWAGIEDSNGTNLRYGRAFAFDAGAHQSYLQSTDKNGGSTPGLSPYSDCRYDGTVPHCQNDGYLTHFSWGYRISASLNYPGFMGTSWKATPSVYFSHDVKGNSIDYQFLQDRKTLSLGLGFSLNNVHQVELNYTTYANDATYNTGRDRDNVSIVYSYTF